MTNILVSAHADGQFEHAVYGAPRSRRPLNVHWRELERTAGTNLLYIRVTKSAAFSQLIFSGLDFDGLWGFDPLPPLPEKRDECGPRVTRRAVVTWQPGPFRNPKQAACAQASGTRREGGGAALMRDAGHEAAHVELRRQARFALAEPPAPAHWVLLSTFGTPSQCAEGMFEFGMRRDALRVARLPRRPPRHANNTRGKGPSVCRSCGGKSAG